MPEKLAKLNYSVDECGLNLKPASRALHGSLDMRQRFSELFYR
jgi:hypothetical protein